MFSESILCGILCESEEYIPIYCNARTGECYFEDPSTSYTRAVSELSVDDPVEANSEEDLIDLMDSGVYGDCIGVILTKDYIYKILSDSQALRVPSSEPDSMDGEVLSIDIYADYSDDM